MKLFRFSFKEQKGRSRYLIVEEEFSQDQESVGGTLIDPLSGEPFEGFGRLRRANALVEEVKYPIDHSFEIDTANFFQPHGYPFKDGIDANLLGNQFIAHIREFLGSEKLLVALDDATRPNDLRIMSSDLTGTGFDFLRQHYRRIKLDCLFAAGVVTQSALPPQQFENSLPTWEELNKLLTHAQKYPTSDTDWPLGEWIQISNTTPLTLDNYPLIQTVWNLSLAGDQICDLSILERCVRLKCLTLDSISVRDLSVLSKIPMLVNLELKNLDPVDLNFLGELSSLEYLTISETPVDFAAIEKLDRLRTLVLCGAKPSTDSLAAFRKARPDVSLLGR